jgi:N-acetylmuramoyl-L-alanine amidase
MTRDNDTFVSLPDRVKMARQAQAALFLSIHADTLNVSPQVRGATIYTRSDLATDAESARLADKENKADAVAGVESHDEPEDVAGILMDLTKRETKAFSGQFARKVVGDLQSVVKLNKNPQRSASFRVLKAPDVPSVLIELGYLSSAQDADLLTSDAWRERTTEALAQAIDRFLATRVAAQPGAVVSP